MENYEKVKQIGKGSFGKVLLVRSKTDQNFYALKRILLSALDRPSASPSNETQLMQSLIHPNIIKYHDSFEHKGDLCIIMEYAQNGDLSQKIFEAQMKKKYFTEDQIISWLTQLCLALTYLHENKIIHRDIKNSNIFLTQNNLLKLGDFGISKKLESTNDFTKTTVGTPFYLPPEMLDRKNYEHYNFAIDVWMMGCVMYELCTLQKPFYEQGESWESFFQKIVFENPKPIPDFYSPFLQKLITRMLNKIPGNRIKVSELLEIEEIQEKFEELKKTNKLFQEYFKTRPPPFQNRNSLTSIIKKRKNSIMSFEKTPNISSENSIIFASDSNKDDEVQRKEIFRSKSKHIKNVSALMGMWPPGRSIAKKISSDFLEVPFQNSKKTYQKAISINTIELESHFANKKQGKGESLHSLDSIKNTELNPIPTEKAQSKKFNFMSCFEHKTPNSSNRTILSSEFLKNKLGAEKFLRMKEWIESSGNPLKLLEDRQKIAEIIGAENLECLQIYKFLICNAVTPSNSNVAENISQINDVTKEQSNRMFFTGAKK